MGHYRSEMIGPKEEEADRQYFQARENLERGLRKALLTEHQTAAEKRAVAKLIKHIVMFNSVDIGNNDK